MTDKSPYDRKVREFLSRDVIWAEREDSLTEALSLMIDHRVSALPVEHGGACVGMLSVTDLLVQSRELEEFFSELGESEVGESGSLEPRLLDRLAEKDFGRRKVRDVMTDDVATVDGEATLLHAAQEMLRNRVHRLPVVDKTAKLIGMLSTMDVLEGFVAGRPKD